MKSIKVLHVLYTYFPDVTGSSIRSEGIISGQKKNGLDVVAVTSPFQKGFENKCVEDVNGVKVYRAYNKNESTQVSEKKKRLYIRLMKFLSIFSFIKLLIEISKKEEVKVIHAHSMFYCGLSSYVVSRILKLKYVYEYRSVWEERFSQSGISGVIQNKIITFLETLSMKLADEVVVINEGLKSNVISRGVSEEKTTVIPNAVSDELIKISKNSTFPKKIRTFGYVGNFSDIEGLDILVKAFCDAFPYDKFPDCRLNFFGRGPYGDELKSQIESLSDSRIYYGGGFLRDDIMAVYSDIDCIVIPRKKLKISDIVTPLKPLEAMAFKRLVIGSDCLGIKEVCLSSSNALFFEADSVSSLSEILKNVYFDPRLDIAKNGRDFVVNSRNWTDISSAYIPIYS